MAGMTRAQANRLRVAELREALLELGLPTDGIKKALVDRLIDAQQRREQGKGQQEGEQGGEGGGREEEEEKKKKRAGADDRGELEGAAHADAEEVRTDAGAATSNRGGPGPAGAPADPTPPALLFVSNLCMRDKTPAEAVDAVRWVLSHYGGVLDVDLVKDAVDGGYGDAAIVSMAGEREAAAAAAALDRRYTTGDGSAPWSLRRTADAGAGAAAS